MSHALANCMQPCIEGLGQQKIVAADLRTQDKLSRLFLKGVEDEIGRFLPKFQGWHRLPAQYMNTDQIARTVRDACYQANAHIGDIAINLERAASLSTITIEESAKIQSNVDKALEFIERIIAGVESLFERLVQGDTLRLAIRQYKRDHGSLDGLFESRILSLPRADRGGTFSQDAKSFSVQFHTLPWFWQPILRPKYLPRGVRSPIQGDGAVITKDLIRSAREVLKAFVHAWYAVNTDRICAPTDTDRLDALVDMPKIATILHFANREDLFNKFAEHEIYDRDIESGVLSRNARAMLQEDASYIEAQIQRVEERPWAEGTNLELQPDEPLPLQRDKAYKMSGALSVDKVIDAWHPEKTYARKVVWTDAAAEGQSSQLQNEISCLRNLSSEDHGHHIVRVVKTYERGRERGMLILPLADKNLSQLLISCCSNPAERTRNRNNLIQACGCLAYSLCYLHNIKKMRHRDVKPHNILCLRKTDVPVRFEFIWADFGLAYDFSTGANSRTIDRDFRATPQYEAPEINAQPGSVHGRSADVFSLGCIFLEIVSVLALPQGRSSSEPEIRRWFNYKDHLRDLEGWINQTKHKLNENGDKTLRKILEIAQDMIRLNPRNRPKIGHVAMRLADIRIESDPIAFCESCKEKYRTRPAAEQNILKHEKFDWRYLLPHRLTVRSMPGRQSI